MKKRGGLVYSTELGRTCPDCRQPVADCRCAARQPAPQGDGVVRVSRETAGRKGAGVTVITGLPLNGADLAALASVLKKRCGSGGTSRDGRIEIQGDHRDLLVTELGQRGYRVKRVGG
jgi:translation initiation factor 1